MPSQPVFALLSSMQSKHRICLAEATMVRCQVGNSATVCITDSSPSLAPILRPFACSSAVFVVEPVCPCESSRSPQRMARASQTTLCPKMQAVLVFPTSRHSGEHSGRRCAPSAGAVGLFQPRLAVCQPHRRRRRGGLGRDSSNARMLRNHTGSTRAIKMPPDRQRNRRAIAKEVVV